MEFDIGTLLYIAITVIAIVASIVGKKKKSQQGSSSKGQGSGSTGFFGRLEEQFGGMIDEAQGSVDSIKEEIGFGEDESELQKTNEPQVQQPVNISRSNNSSPELAYTDFEGVYDPDKQENAEVIEAEAVRTTGQEENIQLIDLDESFHPDYFEIVKDFDLGTAVIYSTIINRLGY
ncbi:MAG: hypothetical protein K9J30_12225 [Bacteroidales bacterium]|nr:hypothetical protein [Bacteroidales bacterium]